MYCHMLQMLLASAASFLSADFYFPSESLQMMFDGSIRSSFTRKNPSTA